jgi:hypothetical protein
MTADEQAKLDECLAADHGLTNWEMEFLDSLNRQRDMLMSEKQAACLEKINAKVLG